MTTNAPRAPIDFDAFERDLRLAEQLQAGSVARRSDPVAELARIVGQDDPFRALLAARRSQAAAGSVQIPMPERRVEPQFVEAPQVAQHVATPSDAFDQYLASVEQEAYAESADEGVADEHLSSRDEEHELADEGMTKSSRGLAGKFPRSRLVQVGAGLGVLAVCVTGALVVKGMGFHGSSGGPVTVLADKSPLKVAPTAADGVEIPDQNKQIYDRTAKEGQIRVVNREEQPLDVAQAARSSRDGDTRGGVTPGNTALLTESLGSPRRVRTVAVKPDTPPPAPAPQREDGTATNSQGSTNSGASPIPTMTMPDGAGQASSTAAARKPGRTLASKPVTNDTASPPVDDGTSSMTASTGPDQDAAARNRKPTRVASVTPETTASTNENAGASTVSAASSAANTGGFSVQIGVRSSEADAQAAFKQMQGKYGALSGKSALIQSAEVNGKSIYRVRVGPLAKAEAASLCTALKGDGGACFVAKN